MTRKQIIGAFGSIHVSKCKKYNSKLLFGCILEKKPPVIFKMFRQIGFVDADDELCHAVKLVGIKTENTPYRDIFGKNKGKFFNNRNNSSCLTNPN